MWCYFLYAKICKVDTINIVQDYINSNNRFTRKTAIAQDKLLDLVSLVLTATWYTFNFSIFQGTDDVAVVEPTSSTISGIYILTSCNIQSTALSKSLGAIF